MIREAKECAVKLAETHITKLDTAILQDKSGRREMSCAVERRGDERQQRQIETQIGTINFQRTYCKKASGGYEYLADTAPLRKAVVSANKAFRRGAARMNAGLPNPGAIGTLPISGFTTADLLQLKVIQ